MAQTLDREVPASRVRPGHGTGPILGAADAAAADAHVLAAWNVAG